MLGGWRRPLWRASAAWVLGALAVVPLLAAEMGDDAYRDAVAQLDARAEKALDHCKSLAAGSGAQRRCTVEADTQHAVDAAELQARRHPSGNNRFKAMAAQVDRHYALAVEACKTDHAGSDKDSKAAQQDCLRQAKQLRAGGIQRAHQQAASEASIAASCCVSGNSPSMGAMRVIMWAAVGAAFQPAVVQPWVCGVGLGLSSMTYTA